MGPAVSDTEALVLWTAAATVVAPGALGFAASRALGLPAPRARALASASAWLSLIGAVGCALGLAFTGTIVQTVFRPLPGIGFGLHLDGLTAVMLLTVSLIGAVVARYSVRYLDGDPGQARFSQWLCLTLSSVLTAMVSSSLVMFLLASVLTSFGLDRLLRHKHERPGAQLAARERSLLARLGDLLLIGACVSAFAQFGSLDFATILDPAAGGAGSTFALPVLAFLLVGWAVTQSAQLPFHSWLPNTMEAPTPVSALMHAGIVNAGGFLLIRTSPLLVQEPWALALLVVVGTTTAVFGALVMLTQTEIKAKYAYSTVSQMGFMLLQCGLGAFGAAALHIVGHSFYKGHAFLSAAAAVDPEPPPPGDGRLARFRAGIPAPRRWTAFGALAGMAIVGGVAFAMGVDPAEKPGAWVLLIVLSLAVGQIVQLAATTMPTAEAGVRGPILRDLAIAAIGIAGLYVVGVSAARAILGTAIPAASAVPAPAVALVVFVIAAFGAAMALQGVIAWGGTRWQGVPWWRAAHVHLRNGLYVGIVQARLIARVWPAGPAQRPHPPGPALD